MDSDMKIINKNPNRENVFLDKKIRLPNQYGTASYEEILKPIAEELLQRQEKYPMTIVYLKLKYCGFAYQLFNRILEDCQFVGDDKEPCSRLFAQFHAPQTSRMKVDILNEIKKESSRIRVLFATTALGMGVNVPYVSRIIHIGPPLHSRHTCKKLAEQVVVEASRVQPCIITTQTLRKTRILLTTLSDSIVQV